MSSQSPVLCLMGGYGPGRVRGIDLGTSIQVYYWAWGRSNYRCIVEMPVYADILNAFILFRAYKQLKSAESRCLEFE